MSLKLRIASFWMPSSLLIPEIDRVAEVTVKHLDQLLREFAPEQLRTIQKEELMMKGNIEQRRKIMATAHNVRVKTLIDALGCDDAVEIGRKALFKAGLLLGQEARERLNVGESLQDLIRAARILYHVLGIEFRIKKSGEDILMVVERCSLATYYSPETCRILSATDEGVVQGLNPNIHMIFKERMTEGPSECLACITIVINRP
jgi:hypothetical protein